MIYYLKAIHCIFFYFIKIDENISKLVCMVYDTKIEQV